MKKIKYLLVFVSAFMLMLAFSVTSSAATKYKSGVFTYTVANGKATIINCDSSAEGHLVIPERFDNHTVTAIGDGAFGSRQKITDITIPESIKSIGDYAFPMSLENVYVDSMDFWFDITFKAPRANPMFYAENFYVDGKLLTDLVVPERVTAFSDYLLYNFKPLKSISFTNPIKQYGNSWALGCDNLEAIYVDSFETWNNCNFQNGYSSMLNTVDYLYINGEPVVDLVVPEGTTRLGDYVFSGYTALKSITIPESVEHIGIYAFTDELENVYVKNIGFWYNLKFESSIYNPMHYAENFYVDGKLLTELVVPEGITALSDYIFGGFNCLKSVTLPKSLQMLGQANFDCCNNIYTDSLEHWIQLFENGEKAGKDLWASSPPNLYIGGELLVDLVIPESVTKIPKYTFLHMKTIESVTLHEDFLEIGGNAFSRYNNIKEIYVPNLEVWFRICSTVNRLRVDNQTVETLYINGEPVVDLVIPENIDTIVTDAFLNYKKLRSITFTKPIKEFGSFWAYGCDNLEAVYVDSFETLNACKFTEGSEHPLSKVDYLYINGEPVVDLVIPEGTTRISDYVFWGYKALKSITIPDSLEYIGWYAFDCSNLESVYVNSLEPWLKLCESMVSSVGSNPMQYAENLYVAGELLVDVVIPESCTVIPKLAFYNINSVKSLTLHSNVKKIETGAINTFTSLEKIYVPSVDFWLSFDANFKSVYKLKNLYVGGELLTDYAFPEGVTKIPSYAFTNYSGLKTVTFPSSLKSIGASAFSGCVNLKSITLPSSLKSIETKAFLDCTNIESVYAPSLEDWLSIDFASPDSNPLVTESSLYIDGELLETLRVPENISKINPYAFYGYSKLNRFEITGSPLIIGYHAFSEGCRNMEIHAETLEDWFSVKTDTDFYLFKDYCNPMYLGATLYIGGKQPEEIVIPESVKLIPDYAFQNCNSLKKITIPATTKIGYAAFKDSGLREAIIGSLTEKIEPVRGITDSTFKDCTKLNKVTLGYGVKSIGSKAFYKLLLNEVVLCSGIESIGDNAFYNTNIVSLTIPSTVKSIGKYAFKSCYFLTDLAIGDKVGGNAVTEVADYAFYNCTKLEKVTLNTGVKKMGKEVFYKCSEIKDLYVNDLVSYLAMKLPVGYQAQDTTPTRYADNIYLNGKILKNLVIPEGVTHISHFAFRGCKTLETVKFPSTLIEIGDGAFLGCHNLKDFTMPESVETIGESAFHNCRSLTKLELKKKLIDVGMDAFAGCTGLKTVYMYPQQLNIGEWAFMECENIEVILYTGTEEAWNELLRQNKNSGLESVAVYFRFRPESMNAPKHIEAVSAVDSITLTWSKINGVTGYRVYVKKDGKWKTVKTLNKNTYKVAGLNSGKKYTFAVKAYISSGAFVLWAPEYITINTATKPLKPSEVSFVQSTKAIKLSWGNVNGADGYRVYQYDSKTKKYKKIKTLSGTSYKVENLKAGTTYKFKIKAYKKVGDNTIWGDATSAVTIATKPLTPSITKLTTTRGKASYTWSNVSGESGYQVYYSTKKDSGYKKVASYKTNVVKGSKSNLTSKKTYYFKVRAFKKTDSGTVYSAWSPVKSIKVK